MLLQIPFTNNDDEGKAIKMFENLDFGWQNLLIIALLFGVFQLIIWGVGQLLKRSSKGKAKILDESRRYTLMKLVKYVLYTLWFVLALDNLGMDIGILLTSAAAFLIAIALGVQHLFDDFVSGFLILFDSSIKVGDIIDLEGRSVRVSQIDLRTTKVVTLDGNYVIIPNSTLTKNNISNWSHGSRISRFHIRLGVAYGSDTDLVKNVLERAARSHPAVLTNEPVIARFEKFGDSALEFDLVFWAQRSWYIENFKSDIHTVIDKEFQKHGIKVPFPQREIYMHTMNDQPGKEGSAS
jgi:small-conductance mechanosensitive channel